jgi:ABC-2 type transport system permease protein
VSNVSTSGSHRGIAPHRIGAMILRYWYLMLSSWPRLTELVYWPTLQIVSWGFLQVYISQNAGFFARAGGTFIGAIMLWDILFRGQLGFSISFLEEMWARNLGNLMMSPLKPVEFLLALMIMSLIRLAIGVIPMILIALFFFHFNLIGLRNGLGAESIVWSLMFGILPLVCVYYPVTVLPHWLQVIAWALPPTYVFEGMRALLINHTFRADLMIDALAINAGLLIASFAAFMALLNSGRRAGSLLQSGE